MTQEYADFDDLTTPSEEEAGEEGKDLVLPSGKKVRVRGLSRYEWFMVGKSGGQGQDGDAAEATLLRLGMVTPKLTVAQAEKWRKTPGQMADIGVVSDRIRQLTGVEQGAQKSAVSGV